LGAGAFASEIIGVGQSSNGNAISDPQAGLEKMSGRLSNNFGLNSAKPQIYGRRRLNKNPAG